MRCVCACRPATGHDRGSPSCPDSSVQVHPNYVSWRCAVAFGSAAGPWLVRRAQGRLGRRRGSSGDRRDSIIIPITFRVRVPGSGMPLAGWRARVRWNRRTANGWRTARNRTGSGTRKPERGSGTAVGPRPALTLRDESRDTKNYRNRPDLRRREVQYMHEPCAGSSLGRLSRCPGLHRPPRAPPHASLADATKVRFPSAMRSGASGDP